VTFDPRSEKRGARAGIGGKHLAGIGFIERTESAVDQEKEVAPRSVTSGRHSSAGPLGVKCEVFGV
jgi:hypothetical protein